MGETTEQWRAAIGRWSGGRPGKCVIMESFAGRKRDNDSFRWFSCFLLASILVIGCVELNPGPNGVEDNPATTYQDGALPKYIKRPGSVGIEGELYGIRLASFLFARGLYKTEEFHLASNVDDAGAFDDVVFKYRLKGQDICKTCFIQLKHKKNKKIEKPILRSSLFHLSGDFSLFKYFESYCEIKRNVSKDRNLKIYGSFIDFEFIIYTNASLEGGIEVGYDKNLVSILSSGPNDGKYVTFEEKSGKDVFEYFKELSIYYSFLLKMAAYTDKDIKQEIENIKIKFTNGDIKKKLERLKSEQSSIALKKLIKELEKCDFSLYPEFLQKVKIFQCQANESSFEKLIKEELQEACHTSSSGTNSIYEKLKEGLGKWWKEEGEVDRLSESSRLWQNIKQLWIEKIKKLSKIDVQGSIEFGIRFTEQHMQPLSEALQRSKLLNVITKKNCGTLSKLKIYQALNSLAQENSLFISLKSLLDRREEIREFWPCKWSSVLVIDCEEGSDNVDKYLADILTDILDLSHKKCVVISQHKHPHLASQLQQKLENVYAEYEDDCNFVDLDYKSQELVLKRTVDFQGTEIPLEALIGKDPLEDIKQSINSQALSLLLGREQKLCIGRKLSDSHSCYVSRILEQQVYLNDDILKLADTPDAFAITGLEPSQLEHYLPFGKRIYEFKFDEISRNYGFKIVDPSNKPIGHHNVFQSVKPEEVRYVILGNKHPESNFKELKKFCKNVHWVHRKDDFFVWRDSSSDIVVIRKYIDKTKCESYDVRSILKHNDSTMLLAAEPGMGKSTFLSHKEHEIKKWKPSMWVLRLNLNDHTRALDSTEFEEECIEKCKEFLWEAAHSEEQNALELENKIFLHALEQTGNVVVMLDGFDEISPHYNGKVEKLIREIRNKIDSKIWVSSRSSYKMNLEKILIKFAFTLRQLTREEQITFLEQYWNKKNGELKQGSLRNFAEKLLRASSKNFNDKNGNFTGIPLHTMMLAEAFENEAKNYCSSGKVNLPENFNLLDLFRKFSETKCNIYLEEKIAMDCSKSKAKTLREKYVKKHMIPALMSLFSRDELNRLLDTEVTTYLKKATKFLQNEEADQCGMISNFTESRPRFIHRCFAEYFSAKWFSKHFSRCNSFISDTLFNPTYEVIRNIFDRMLAEESKLHDAVLNNDPEAVNKLLGEKTDVNSIDKGGRTALHLAASYNSIIINRLLSVTGVDTNIPDGVLKWKPLKYAATTRSWMAVDSLLQGGADGNVLIEFYQDKEWRRAALFECAEKGHRNLLEFILNSGFDVNEELISGSIFNNFSLLHIASQYSQEGVVRLLIERGADINVQNFDYDTALHFAVERGNVGIMTLLVDKIMSVNETSTGGMSPIYDAVGRGNLTATEFLVERGADLEVADAFGRTPLMVAASGGHLEVVRYLAMNGADVNACTNNKTALLLATKGAHLNVMGFLLEQGADINGSNVERGMSPLQVAIENYDLQTVKFLIESGADINVPSFKNETAIHFAAQADNVDLMTLLVDKGMSVNETCTRGETPLHEAARHGNLRATDFLVERGADINVRSFKNETALHFAAKADNVDIMTLLVDKGMSVNQTSTRGKTPLQKAARHGNLRATEFLVERGADINVRSFKNETVLHLAAKADNVDIMTLLVNKGMSVNETSTHGETPLHEAARHGNLGAAEFLVERGADINVHSFKNETALHFAAKADNVNLMTLLVDKGLSVNETSTRSKTPLHKAVRYGNVCAIEFLVKGGADLEIANNIGRTPLMVAAYDGYPEIVRYLAMNGADVNSCTNDVTALHLATIAEHLDVMCILLDHGADINGSNVERGTSPLQLAIENNDLQTVKYFIEREADVNFCSRDGSRSPPLHLAVICGNLDAMNCLIEAGANLNVLDRKGCTPLHHALSYKQTEFAMHLVENGADVNIPDARGTSPLQLSVIKDNVKFAKLFLKFNPNVNYQGPKKLPALSMAIKLGRMNIVNFLVENGADINLHDNRGQTALHAAVWKAEFGLVQYLIARGADVNISDSAGRSPLQLSVIKDNVKFAKLFVNCNANVNYQGPKKLTALSMAIRLGRMNIVNVLVEIGADINLRDDRGQTALHAAVMRGDPGLVDYLIARGADVNIPNIRLETPVDWIYSLQWENPADHLERHERMTIPDLPLLVDLFTTEAF